VTVDAERTDQAHMPFANIAQHYFVQRFATPRALSPSGKPLGERVG
jgi:hypothetical protein